MGLGIIVFVIIFVILCSISATKWFLKNAWDILLAVLVILAVTVTLDYYGIF
jgi:hypothetical protein